jgi:putative chitinase
VKVNYLQAQENGQKRHQAACEIFLQVNTACRINPARYTDFLYFKENSTMLLQKGSHGDDVKSLQDKLGAVADGIFGAGTEQLVKDWQIAHGLDADGIVGEKTWNLLFPEVSPHSNIDEVLAPLDRLTGHVPDTVITQLDDATIKSKITNNLRLAHFLSQCCHESGNFKLVVENLNYNAHGLVATFPSVFDATLAVQYEHNAEKIASKVYANRMGNGDEASKDGYTYRGRGYIQLTGKSNYQKFAEFIGAPVTDNPDLVATQYPLISAAYFFTANNIWSLCDQGSSNNVITAVTRKINGGTNGLDERTKYFTSFYALLSA